MGLLQRLEQRLHTARNWLTSGNRHGHHGIWVSPRRSAVGGKEVLRKELHAPPHLRTNLRPGIQQRVLACRMRLQRAHHPVLVEEDWNGAWWPTATWRGLDDPLTFGTNGCNIDPPNPADVVPTRQPLVERAIGWSRRTVCRPCCYQAHRAQHVDPETGEATRLSCRWPICCRTKTDFHHGHRRHRRPHRSTTLPIPAWS